MEVGNIITAAIFESFLSKLLIKTHDYFFGGSAF